MQLVEIVTSIGLTGLVAASLALYSDIPPELLTPIEDLVLNRRPHLFERLNALV